MTRRLLELPRVAWLALGTAVVLVAGYFAFQAVFVKVGRSVEQPFAGPARYDEYYVLQRYLEQRGLRVSNVRSWPQPLSRDVVVLWLSSEDVPEDVRRWLAEGGRLWTFRDPDATVERDAWNWRPTPWSALEEQEQAASAAEEAQQTEPPQEDEQAADDLDEHWCAEHGCLVAAQFHYGAGCLTLVGPFGLQNEQVIQGETPARIDGLLRCPSRPASVLVVTGAGSPWFGRLLLEHAPQALLACAALLALGLWRAARHLGPKLPPRKRERRQMLEHVGAVGTLAGRVGSASLLVAARRELRKRVFQRAPQSASLSGEALVTAVAQATEIPASEVRRALLDEPAGDSQTALAVARAVQTLWRKT